MAASAFFGMGVSPGYIFILQDEMREVNRIYGISHIAFLVNLVYNIVKSGEWIAQIQMTGPVKELDLSGKIRMPDVRVALRCTMPGQRRV